MILQKTSIIAVIFFANLSFAQTVTPAKAVKLGTIDIHQHEEVWNVNIQNMEMPSPDGDSEKSILLRLKNTQTEKYPRNNSTSTFEKSNTKSLGDSVFSSIMGFEGNAYNNRVPNDNTIAISNDGILISCNNSRFLFYDTEADTLMKLGFLNDFISSYNLTVSKYDPKLTYDPIEDRFILVFLAGTNYQISKIPVAFSSSNNPMDPWHVYLVEGNAIGSNHWTDYPAIALNYNDFFITGNLLENNTSWQTGFSQSLIWQIDKWSGYNGDSLLNMQIWSDIKENNVNIRNIHPVKSARTLGGEKQYFLSNRNFAAESDTVYLISIDNTLNSGIAQMEVRKLSNPNHYFMAPNAQQSIAKELATNDSRVLGAIMDENWIQYVHNTLDTATGTCAVYHGIIENYEDPSPTLSGKIISDTVMDLGYPNIASSSENINDKEVVIGFNFTSPVDTNGVACVYMNNIEEYSNIIKLKVGNSPISVLSGNLERWGDYFGIQRKFDEPCSIWIGGMYGKSIGNNGTWISKVNTKENCFNNFASVPIKETQTKATVFPNPTSNIATIEFEIKQNEPIKISICDLNGKNNTLLYNDLVKKGMNRLTFNLDHLSTGIYIIQIQGDKTQITKKLIVE